MLQLNETLENGVIGLVISLVGTYFIAVFKGAEAIDSEREKESSTLRKRVEELTPPEQSVAEVRRIAKVKAAIAATGADAVVILRFLEIHGSIVFRVSLAPSAGRPFPLSQLPEGMSEAATHDLLERCCKYDLVTPMPNPILNTGTPYGVLETVYRIAQGYSDVIGQCLDQIDG